MLLAKRHHISAKNLHGSQKGRVHSLVHQIDTLQTIVFFLSSSIKALRLSRTHTTMIFRFPKSTDGQMITHLCTPEIQPGLFGLNLAWPAMWLSCPSVTESMYTDAGVIGLLNYVLIFKKQQESYPFVFSSSGRARVRAMQTYRTL